MEKLKWHITTFEAMGSMELYEMLRLRNEVFVVEQDCPYQDLDRKDYASMHIFGYLDDEVVAYCRVMDKGISYDDYASIGRVVTSMKIRRQGYGHILMEKAINLCLENYSASIKLSGQAYLRDFYESLGFQVVSETTYLEDNIPHYAMVYKPK